MYKFINSSRKEEELIRRWKEPLIAPPSSKDIRTESTEDKGMPVLIKILF
jgi:hypothetical protein